ncbi:sugar phosphate nucleotidyltransferase [Peribacillus asahii]|uniref:sugar phosphate nucleotidyltransferase n=1 Tax=Peribacillus asahii TaxID=228899 RepID=UPI00207AC9AE|nr:sugar phosphate nucleotidyltransferase [Peribacillus asahii]USK68335.1 mannose-1-phosphate guanylyltransferase [Peribacillus asahii]
MKVILLSGGSGRRLWPLSNDSRSKQFLKLLESNEGNLESMAERVWRQLREVGLSESTIIATGKSQVDILQNQLGTDIPIIVEPERRDTFPAIALSAVYLYSIIGVSLDEIVTILPIDSYVDNQFYEYIKNIENVLNESEASLALVGVKPSYPSSKYGYIIPKDVEAGKKIMRISHFVEKPEEAHALHLIEKNALWNCGVFSFKLDFIISILQKMNLPIQYEELLKHYNHIPKNSFDYEVVEKVDDIVALQYDGRWKDLGTWNTLTAEMSTNQIGTGVLGPNTLNTHLINEQDRPVAVLGIPNAVIVVSPDGVLVADKKFSPKIKTLIADISQRPMYEERRWGWYKVLDYFKYEDCKEVLTKRIGLSAGKNLSYQVHFKRSEVWTVVKGEGHFVLNETLQHVREGTVLEIPLGARHAIKAVTDLEFIEVQKGTELIEEDIHRISLNWDDILLKCSPIRN